MDADTTWWEVRFTFEPPIASDEPRAATVGQPPGMPGVVLEWLLLPGSDGHNGAFGLILHAAAPDAHAAEQIARRYAGGGGRTLGLVQDDPPRRGTTPLVFDRRRQRDLAEAAATLSVTLMVAADCARNQLPAGSSPLLQHELLCLPLLEALSAVQLEQMAAAVPAAEFSIATLGLRPLASALERFVAIMLARFTFRLSELGSKQEREDELISLFEHLFSWEQIAEMLPWFGARLGRSGPSGRSAEELLRLLFAVPEPQAA